MHHTLDELLDMLENPDVEIRLKALKTFDFRSAGYLIPNECLIKLLNDSDFRVKSNTLRLVGKLENLPSVLEIKKFLDDEDFRIRKKAAFILALRGNKRAFLLASELLHHQDYKIRLDAMRFFAELYHQEAHSVIIKGLKDPHEAIRATAASILGRSEDRRALQPLLQALSQEEDPQTHRTMISALGKLKDSAAIPPLLTLFYNTSDEPLKREIIEAFGTIGDHQTVKLLIEALKDQSTLHEAAKALGKLGDIEAVEPLIEMLDDEKIAIRSEAAKALGNIGDRRAVEKLTELFQGTTEEWARMQLAFILARFGNQLGRQYLYDSLDSPEAKTRGLAAINLGGLGELKSIPILINMLDDDAPFGIARQVRHMAAQALVEIGTPEAIEIVIAWNKNMVSTGYFLARIPNDQTQYLV